MVTHKPWNPDLHPRRPDGEFTHAGGDWASKLAHQMDRGDGGLPAGHEIRPDSPDRVQVGDYVRRPDDGTWQRVVGKVNKPALGVIINAGGKSFIAKHGSQVEIARPGDPPPKAAAPVAGLDQTGHAPDWASRVSGQIEQDRRPAVTHQVYHVTRAADLIHANGFRTGEGEMNGAFFGAGVYFNTKKNESDQFLQGLHAFAYGDETQMRAAVTIRNPFKVAATTRDEDPGALMMQALVRAGIARPGQKWTPAKITQELKARGYDSVQVDQKGFNHEIGGSQIVVFDVENAKPVR